MTEQGTGRTASETEVPRFMARTANKAGVKITGADLARAEKALSGMGPLGYAFNQEND